MNLNAACLALAGSLALALAAGPVRLERGAPPRPSFYALYAWVGDYLVYADDVQKTGIRWVRAGGWLEGNPDATDKAVLVAARNRVRLVPVLELRGMGHGRIIPMDRAIPQWREHVRRSVERYGPRGALWREHPEARPLAIRYWEIWNEPNIEFLTPPEGTTRAEVYAQLLKAACEEIRQADPAARIIAFNCAGGTSTGRPSADALVEPVQFYGWRRFIREANAVAGADCYDAIGLHPYTQPQGPEEGGVIEGLSMLQELAREQGFEGKEVWFTEVGYAIAYPRNRQVKDEREQASFLLRLFAVAAAHGVTQVQVMYATDITYGQDGSRRAFGFFTDPGEWRPQAKATQVMIRLVPDPRQGGQALSEEQGGVFAYRFDGAGGGSVIMAWTTAEQGVRRSFAALGEEATAVDFVGGTQELPVRDGKVEVELSGCPVYIVFQPREAVDELLSR
jgi:hypothetical protein